MREQVWWRWELIFDELTGDLSGFMDKLRVLCVVRVQEAGSSLTAGS